MTVNEFIQTFGHITLADVAVYVAALIFLVKVYQPIKAYIVQKYENEKEKTARFSKTIEDVRVELANITRIINENEASVCRYRVLRFNDEIIHKVRHTKEHFDQVLDDITSYEQYCEDHPEYENNKAVLAIANIKRTYEKCTRDGDFL